MAEVFGSERLTGALLDRLTMPVNGDSSSQPEQNRRDNSDPVGPQAPPTLRDRFDKATRSAGPSYCHTANAGPNRIKWCIFTPASECTCHSGVDKDTQRCQCNR